MTSHTILWYLVAEDITYSYSYHLNIVSVIFYDGSEASNATRKITYDTLNIVSVSTNVPFSMISDAVVCLNDRYNMTDTENPEPVIFIGWVNKTEGETLITLLGMVAQNESLSISKNLRWSIQKRMQNGTYILCPQKASDFEQR